MHGRVRGGATRAVDAAVDQGRVLVGVGVGLMILLDRSILMRVDVAGSPNESTCPAVYTPVKYPF